MIKSSFLKLSHVLFSHSMKLTRMFGSHPTYTKFRPSSLAHCKVLHTHHQSATKFLLLIVAATSSFLLVVPHEREALLASRKTSPVTLMASSSHGGEGGMIAAGWWHPHAGLLPFSEYNFILWIFDALVMVSVYQPILKILLVPGHMTGSLTLLSNLNKLLCG
jgi:hypothetical protein